jgi:hypothetical protein
VTYQDPFPMLRFSTAATSATKLEREQALKRAAHALFARQPKPQADITVVLGPNDLHAHAAWLWPGVVLVTLRWTGDVIARSKPGQPYVLDPACL